MDAPSALAPQHKRGRPRWPLRAYFVAVALLVVALGLLAGGFVYERTQSDARKSAVSDARFAARKAAAQIAAGVRILNGAMRPVLADPTLRKVFSNPRECGFGYAPVGAFESGVIDVIRRDGSVVCGSGGRPATGRPFAGQPWLGARAAVAPVFDATRHRQVAVLSYPVGRLGVVAFLLDLAPVGPKLGAEFGSGVHRLEFLVVSHDVVATRSIDPGRWIGKRLTRTRFSASGRDVEGTARWYRPAAVAGTPWRVYVGADRSSALAAAAGLRETELGILAAGVAAVLLALAFVYSRVARPIRSLSRAVAGSDREEVRVHGPAEVGRLAANVNHFLATIRRSEQSYQRVFESSPLAMFIYDRERLRVLDVNDAAVKLYGYTRGELLGRSVEDIVAAEDRAIVEERAASGEATVRAEDVTHVRKDGSHFSAQVTAHSTSFGDVPARFVMVEDVGEQQRLEERLRQAEKMEVVGQLAAGIAHDFNNILTVISGANALLLRELRNGDEELSRDRLRQIELATEHAAELTRQLLAFGRKQVLEPEPTDLNSVVEETLVLAGRLLTEDIELVSRLEADSATIMIDRNQLQQVILNLCVNARDAMPSGGRLSVHTATAELDDAYAAGRLDVSPGRYALLEITDSGVGMDAPTASRVFEPFFTTKQTGSGLGLASVHGIVKQSGGHISVYSEPGIGTTFRLYLPQTGVAVRRAAETPRSQELEGEETILLVEDAEPLRLLVADTLESYGYTVRTAANGAEALELAHREGSTIDLLLTDVVMPQMSGRELAEHITSSHPQVKVLFTSGYPADTVLAKGITDGRFAYVQKPYLGDTLARKIRETLNADRAPTS